MWNEFFILVKNKTLYQPLSIPDLPKDDPALSDLPFIVCGS
jgi:hypothetical protein